MTEQQRIEAVCAVLYDELVDAVKPWAESRVATKGFHTYLASGQCWDRAKFEDVARRCLEAARG